MHSWQDLSKGVGILGGTFDPIHIGHTEVAKFVCNKYDLARVVIIPAFLNPVKVHEEILAGSRDRLVMAYLATLEEEKLFVDPIEIERGRHNPGPSYMIDTLHIYRLRYPEVPLTLIVGADNVAFHLWKDIDQYPELLRRIAVVGRPTYELETSKDFAVVKERHPKVAELVEFHPEVNIPISSTAVRESLRGGKVPVNVLHPAVSKYILKYGLYGCKEVCHL